MFRMTVYLKYVVFLKSIKTTDILVKIDFETK